MFEEHPVFKLNCSEHSRLWRYLDFTKFVALLEDSALWFSRTDCLSDPFDSELPNSVIAEMMKRYSDAREEAMRSGLDAS